MSESLGVQQIVFNLDGGASGDTNGWQGDGVIGHIFKAPSAALGGAVRLVRAYAVNQAATGAGTGFALALLNYGTAGTAVAGTVAAAIGGTGDPWSAGVPKAFTLADPVIDKDEWLVLKKTEVNSSDPTRCSVVLEFLHGQ